MMRVAACTIALICGVVGRSAGEPLARGFSYQGQLKNGEVPVDGPVDLRFTLFDVEAGGEPLDLVQMSEVPAKNGLFLVQVEFDNELLDGTARWVQVAVRYPHDPGDTVPFETLAPRQPITAVPYALQTRGIVVNEAGDVGIGTNTPSYPLHVETGGERAILGTTTNADGRAVVGRALAVGGFNYGGFFVSSSDDGRGVYGSATAGTGATFGGYFTSSSICGRGLYAVAAADTGMNRGVYGESLSHEGTGVYGLAFSDTGLNFGVFGKSNSTSGYDFFAGGVGLDYGSTSSRRWKRNVRPIDDPLERLARLRGVFFDWDKQRGGHHDVGMIAEEVGQVLPEIVSFDVNGVDAHGMDYSKLSPLLVAGVNALRAKTDKALADRDRRIQALEQAQRQWESRLKELEAALRECSKP